MLKNVLILPDGTEFTAIKSCKLTDCVNDGDEFTIGSAFANIIEATLFDVGAKLSLTAGDEITLYRVADDGTRTKKGVYVLEKPTRPSANILKLIGYDYITKLDKDLTAWVNSLTGWPYALQNFAGVVCSACGLKLRLTEAIPNAGFPVYKPAKANVTGRQLMRWIGEICCRFVRANADGNIELSGYTPSGVTVAPSGERYYFQGALSYETYQVAPIEAVQMRLADSENGALWPEVTESSNSYVITGNALLMARVTSDLLPFLEVIAEQMAGFTYTPCKFAMPACLDVEAGSTVEIIDKNGNRFTTCVMTKTTSGQRDTFESTGSYRRDSSTATNNQPDSTKTDGIGIKTVDVYYYLSASSTELSGGDWSTTAPTWEDGKYIWSKTVTTYSDGSTSESTPACITGAAGQNGTNGVGVENIVTLFYLSTSKTGLRGGAWVTTMPAWSAGYYLWTRSKITYTDGTISSTAPVCDSSWEAVNELDAKLDFEEVLNRLTKNGELKGLFEEDGILCVNADVIRSLELLFAKDIIMTGKFECTAETYLPPTYDDVIYTLRSTFYPEEYPLPEEYDFDLNGDGVFDGDDALMAMDVYKGAISMSSCPGAQKTSATLRINMSDPEKLIHIFGYNMWGTYVETFIGADVNNCSFASREYLQRMINQDPYSSYLYRTVDGEREYINPPLNVGTEYRTAERSDGEVVYCKKIDCGNISGGSSALLTSSSGVPSAKAVVRWSAHTDDGWSLPYQPSLSSNSRDIVAGVQNAAIYLSVGSDYAAKRIYMTLWYTKN